MKKSYYKVVSVENGKYYSAFKSKKQWVLEYKLNTWTYPNQGHIFIFDSLENAKMFGTETFGTGYKYKILKVDVRVVFKPIQKYHGYPSGTRLTDSVYPIKIVK